jgi:hypothetical protein
LVYRDIRPHANFTSLRSFLYIRRVKASFATTDGHRQTLIQENREQIQNDIEISNGLPRIDQLLSVFIFGLKRRGVRTRQEARLQK